MGVQWHIPFIHSSLKWRYSELSACTLHIYTSVGMISDVVNRLGGHVIGADNGARSRSTFGGCMSIGGGIGPGN